MNKRGGHSSRWLLRGMSLWLVVTCLCASVSAVGVETERADAAVSEMGRGIGRLTVDAVPEELMEALTESGERGLAKVEPAQADALNCITVRDSDGSLSRIAFQQPVKYIDEQTNEIRFIDNTIKQPDSLLARAFSEVAYENTSNSIRVSMPKKLGQGVRMERGSDSLKMIPATGQEKAAVKKDVERMDSAETVVEYADAFGEHTSMQYRPVGQGVKEYIVLEQYTGVHEFQFWLDAPGLTPDVAEGNVICFLDANGEAVFVIAKAWAMDSYTEQGQEGEETAPESRHFDDNIHYRLQQAEDGRYLLTMTVSEEFLSSPDTVYPASIQYSAVYGYSQGNINFNTVFSKVSETWPAYAYEYIQTGYRSNYGESIGYVQFEGLDFFNDIYPEKIVRAIVTLKQTYGTSSSSTIGAYASNTSIKCNNATYSVLSSNIGSLKYSTTCSVNNFYNFTITTMFKTWLDAELHGTGTTYQMMFKALNNNQAYKQFHCTGNDLYVRVDFKDVEHGNGGSYRQVNTQEPNCFGYALLLNRSVRPSLPSTAISNTEMYSDCFKSAIERQSGYSCRRIDSYVDDIDSNEYRLAVRAPNGSEYVNGWFPLYHVIYQLSDGTWAGKDDKSASRHFGRSNPSTTPEMWENDTYDPDAGTIYFAVKRTN